MVAPVTLGSTDWDEVSYAVANAYFPHDLHPLGHARAGKARADGVDLGPIRIAHISWGAAVSVVTTHPGAYAVNIPVSGQLESVIGQDEFIATPERATIFPPDTPARIRRWSESCGIIGVRFDRDYLHREIHRVLAEPVDWPPDHLDLTGGAGAAWVRLVQCLTGDMASKQHPLVHEQLCAAITTAFVLAAMPESGAQASALRPRIVKRVVDQLREDPARAWTAGDMAQVAGVSVRRLQEGFRAYLGVTPRELLADIRLARVREELLHGTENATVTGVAMRWGFTHTGRFAAAYRRKYGEPPSQTLHA
ncbi:helix-turn-helix domain-containing protein [Mycobacteroides abscessus]|uniref:AraC family transcriptional regulator n=1 Tax=Mycobacteroides abscessus TaxID=36809 RepID=UPI000300A046|nr:AraC family transcriptional regulator [Mycobacteroides abscessus]CPT65603.1 helix-turn-helix domain-containing protein [Mycobacteroides abscessus]CPU59608.1 helix-turn-helix domain-containing protein [Mycobacteroides abscessus]SKJ90637.1 helix-turn-helix domain-containing protein [Mycobacteroides abscessus subsp. massiliense]SKQ15069.1 helix-turn-helix domain-containing protein [Mycobacteroides abscessus subsp. massiliense]SKV61230.1 helix-turn-helix domain-containing protein [Mycobacteroid